ncbi:MAG TPA: hypothetical protein VKW78_19290 [Terriglobales bacterium]|nr:hypothetical protein [Terriglobales bacterium]
MRILATVLLLLPLAAQCQVAPPNSQESSSKPVLLAQASGALAAVPISQAVSVAPGGQPIIKTAVLKPMKVNTVDERHARNSRIWYSLVVANHIGAGFDAYSTRQAIGHGAQELNPFLKPFASSAAIYPALQVWPTGMDFLGNRMMHSQNRVLRKVWWVPQAASTVAFVSFGFHNLKVSGQ